MKLNGSFATRCGITLLAGLGLLYVHLEAATKYSAWSAPANLGPVVNSLFDETVSSISKDELSLFFDSKRPGVGEDDIWVSQRPRKDAAWGVPLNLGLAINTTFKELTPTLSSDEHYLFFATDRPGGRGRLDIWVSWRAHTQDDFGWQPPENLGMVNSPFNDVGPSLFESSKKGLTLYFSRDAGNFSDIYSSEFITDAGLFGPAARVPELSSPYSDLRPAIRNDGLEIFLSSDRTGTFGHLDLWVSIRNTLSDPWSPPENLGAGVNTEFSELFPTLSSDGQALFFASNRPGFGNLDLYQITRSKSGQP